MDTIQLKQLLPTGTDLFCSSNFLSSSSSAMETSFGSELLLLSGTPRLSPPDLELENEDMDAEGDLDDDEGEDVTVVSSARGGKAGGASAIAASL